MIKSRDESQLGLDRVAGPHKQGSASPTLDQDSFNPF